MALQRTRRPSLRSGRSLRSLGSPLNARPLGLASLITISLTLSSLIGCASNPRLGQRIPTREGAVTLARFDREVTSDGLVVSLEYRSAVSPRDSEALVREAEAVWHWLLPYAERDGWARVRMWAYSSEAELWTGASLRRLADGTWCWASGLSLRVRRCNGGEA